jgi:hypothetical protein
VLKHRKAQATQRQGIDFASSGCDAGSGSRSIRCSSRIEFALACRLVARRNILHRRMTSVANGA